MHASKRESQILNTVRLRGSVTTGELAEMLNVTDQTIRRSVIPLVEQGLVKKVHGAIVSPDRLLEAPFHNRMHHKQEEKQRIAEKTASLINDGASIMFDAGSTTTYIARALHDKHNLTVITNSVQIASILVPNPSNKIFMAGMELRNHDAAAFGTRAVEVFNQFDVQYAILSVAALHHERGLMAQTPYEAELLRVIINRADHIIVAADHSKFDRKSLVETCGFNEINAIVTDKKPSSELTDILSANNVSILIA